MLNQLHPDAATILICRGLLARDEAMEKNVGRKIKFINWTPSMGTITRDNTFTIIGVQKNYRGDLVYRVTCDAYNDTFGRCARIEEIQLV